MTPLQTLFTPDDEMANFIGFAMIIVGLFLFYSLARFTWHFFVLIRLYVKRFRGEI
jgi:hypothetical protein